MSLKKLKKLLLPLMLQFLLNMKSWQYNSDLIWLNIIIQLLAALNIIIKYSFKEK